MLKWYIAGVFLISVIMELIIPIVRGAIGELVIKVKLFPLPKKRYKVLNDIMLKTKRGTTQIDHIVVSIYGIFVIETKNFTGLITGNTNKLEWTKHVGKNKYNFRNPIIQNKGHIVALSKALNISEDKFTSVVVFLSDCKLRVNTKGIVIYSNKLLETILNYKTEKFTIAEIEQIENKIKELNQKGILMKIKHIMYVKERKGGS